MAETKTAKRLTGGIIAIIILAVCLCITTFALVYASVSVENNLFHTGEAQKSRVKAEKLKYFFRRLQAASATYLSKSDPDVSKPKISRG